MKPLSSYRSRIMFLILSAAVLSTAAGAEQPFTKDESSFRALFKELVEINTTRSVGSCTGAAEAMRARLLDAGIPAADMQILAPVDRPDDGALIAVIHGKDKRLKP